MARKPLKDEIAPVKPHLTRGTGGVAGEVNDVREDLKRCMDRIEDEFASKDKTSMVTLWIDGTNGDDTKDGTTEAKAVKTVPRLRALIPDFIGAHFFVIRVKGKVDLVPGSLDNTAEADHTNTLLFNTTKGAVATAGGNPVPSIIIQGENGRTTVLDDGAGGYQAFTGSAVAEIQDTTQTWTTNEHKSLWCEFDTGETYIIDENDGNKLYLHMTGNNGELDPGVTLGATGYKIVRPKTEIAAGPFWMGQSANFEAILRGSGYLYMSNLYFSGGAAPAVVAMDGDANSRVQVSRCVLDSSGTIFGFILSSTGVSSLGDVYWDLTTMTPKNVFVEGDRLGVSQQNDPYIANLLLYCTGSPGIYFARLGRTLIWDTPAAMDVFGTKLSQCNLYKCRGDSHGGGVTFGHTELWGVTGTPTKIGDAISPKSGPALEMYDSQCGLYKCVCDYGKVGIRMVVSHVVMAGVTGSNNTDAGVHADVHSSVLIDPDKALPTISKSGGGVELSKDGTTQASTWAALRAEAATGSITAVAPGSLLDNETFVVGDGTNTITFEFEVTGGFTPTGGAVEVVDVTSAVTADDVAAAIASAINGSTGTLNVTAGTPSGAVVPLSNDNKGAAGNVAITDTVVDAGFTHTGMSGGQDATPVVDPDLVAKAWVPQNGTWRL